jgi:hypothetical protein
LTEAEYMMMTSVKRRNLAKALLERDEIVPGSSISSLM